MSYMLIYFKTNPCVNSEVNIIAKYFLLKTAVNQRLSQKRGLKSLVVQSHQCDTQREDL